MSKIPLSLYQDIDALEEAQLRSVLLFGKFGKEQEGEEFMLQRLILSIIIEGDGKYDLEQIKNILHENFSVEMRMKEINKHMTSLYNDNMLVLQKDTGNYKAIVEENKGQIFFTKLNQDTDELINDIYNRFSVLSPQGAPSVQLVKNTIRDALSVYYKMSGLTFFRLQKKSDNVKNAIQVVFQKLDEKTSKRLITAIGETLESPTVKQKAVLEQWARAFVITQLLQLDPTLSQFKQKQLQEKSFVLDTDVVLHALATHTELSQDYRYCLDYVNKLGCKIYVPKEIIKEVNGCAEEALEISEKRGREQLIELRETLLSSSKSNVFIEDYIRQIFEDPDKHDLNFKTYITNIYRYKHPEIMATRLSGIIGKENVIRQLPVVELDENTEKRLQGAILELTMETAKGVNRTESFNAKVAQSDARLYLTLVYLNANGTDDFIDVTKGLLPYKFYLLTASRRTIKSATQLKLYTENIICSPKALLVALKELGELKGKNVSIVNLFENPFLVYMADQIWERIEPILNRGAEFYHADIQQLKVMVDEKFDNLLIDNEPEEVARQAQAYKKQGFIFTDHYVMLGEKNEALTQVVKEKDKIIETQQQEIEKLRKQRAKERYEERVKNGIKKIKRKK